MKNMTEKEYDQIINEGGEGYNPIRQKREMAELEEAQKQARIRSLTPEGQIEALYRRIELECGSVAGEWGNQVEIDAVKNSLYEQINSLKAGLDSEFLKIWSLEETKTRRAAWNARVKGGEFGTPGSKRVNFKALADRQKTQGWTIEDLKRAIKLHNL